MQSHARRKTILYHHRTRSRDGQSVHIDEMIHAMRKLGHKVVIVEPRRIEATAEPIESQLLPQAIYELFELGYSILEFVKLSVAAILHHPDFLYERENLFMLSGLCVSKLFGLPYLLEVNAPLAEERNRYGGLHWKKLARWTEIVCWKNASFVLPVTDVLAGYIRKEGVPNSRIAVTPNGVDPNIFFERDRVEAKQKIGLADRLVLGFVGYVRDWHGLDVVVDILAKKPSLQNAYLLVVGDGPARASLESQARRLGVSDRLRFTGTMPRQALPDLIAAFDLALQPLVTPYASPLKLFEYMAQGCTIIAPATPNILEILEDHKDSYLYSEPEQFSEAIEFLAGDSVARARLGQAAANKIKEKDLTWIGNARRAVDLGTSLATPRPPN
jgi:glycosyltransferase involved in cell wall biosynthesis